MARLKAGLTLLEAGLPILLRLAAIGRCRLAVSSAGWAAGLPCLLELLLLLLLLRVVLLLIVLLRLRLTSTPVSRILRMLLKGLLGPLIGVCHRLRQKALLAGLPSLCTL